MNRTILRAAGLTVGLLLGTPAAPAANPPAALTAAQLRAELGAAQQKVKSVRAAYRVAMEAEPKKHPAGAYVHRVVAAKEPCYFYHLNTHGHDRLPWEADPMQQRCHVGANEWFVENALNRTFFTGRLKPTDEVPGTVRDEIFFLATGLWPMSTRPAPRLGLKEPFVLREVARCELYSVVRPALEEVDGRWCHVLELPGLDRLWLDADRGCALLRRETHSRRGGPLVTRYELTGHRVAAPGVWLPARIRNTQFDHEARTEAARRRNVIDAVIEVTESRANDVPDEQFVFRPPPGAFCMSSSGQVSPGGLDHLDHLAGWVDRYGAGRRAVITQPPLAHALAGLPVLFLIPVLELRRQWKRRAK